MSKGKAMIINLMVELIKKILLYKNELFSTLWDGTTIRVGITYN